jgi:hypothetical protein
MVVLEGIMRLFLLQAVVERQVQLQMELLQHQLLPEHYHRS